MKTKTAHAQAAANLAAQYLQMAKRALREAEEPALAMAVGGLLTKVTLATSYTFPQPQENR